VSTSGNTVAGPVNPFCFERPWHRSFAGRPEQEGACHAPRRARELSGTEDAQQRSGPYHMPATDEVTPAKPYRLVAAPARQFLNSSFTEMPTSVRREARPTALLEPATIAQRGLADGNPVRLGNERGSVLLYVRGRPGQHPTTIVVESIWPNRHWAEGGRDQPPAGRRRRPAERRCRDPRHGRVAGAGAARRPAAIGRPCRGRLAAHAQRECANRRR
jgi:anaerobic selenocysteine-containing dehydrogenase